MKTRVKWIRLHIVYHQSVKAISLRVTKQTMQTTNKITFFCEICIQIKLWNNPLKCVFPTQCGLTVRLPPAGLGEVLLGSVCIAQLQRGDPSPVKRFGVLRSSLQHAQAVLLDTGVIHTLFLEQTCWERLDMGGQTNKVGEMMCGRWGDRITFWLAWFAKKAPSLIPNAGMLSYCSSMPLNICICYE